MPDKIAVETDGERLVRIETKLDMVLGTILESYERRLTRLENGLMGTVVALILSVGGGLAIWLITK